MERPAQKMFIIDTHADLLAQALQSTSTYTVTPCKSAELDITLQYLQREWRARDVALISAEALGPPADLRGLELVRRWWIQTVLQNPKALLSPVVLLTYEDINGLLRRNPLYIFILSRVCRVVRKPFLHTELLHAINAVAEIKATSEDVEKYLRSSTRLVTLTSGIEHAMRNLLGPFSLLRGAYIEGAVDRNQYDRVWETLHLNLGEKLGVAQNLSELLYLYGTQVPEALDDSAIAQPTAGTPPALPDFIVEAASRANRGDKKLHILVIDDEAEQGWCEVYQEMFGSSATLEVITRVQMPGQKDGVIFLHKPPAKFAVRDFRWQNYDLVLLDLRLATGDMTAWDDQIDDDIKRSGPSAAQNFSGIRVLKALRDKDPVLPVIMMTASKKSYNLETAKSLGRVWFLSKEEFARGSALGENLDDRARAYYGCFRDYIQEALARDRQNLRRIWQGIESLTVPEKGKKCVHGLKRAFVLLSAIDLDSSFENFVGEKSFASEAVVCVTSALESIGYRTGGEEKSLVDIAEELGKATALNDNGEKAKFFAFTIHEIRGVAAHGPGSACIDFQDGLFCLWLALKALGEEVELFGYPHAEFACLQKRWIFPTLQNLNSSDPRVPEDIVHTRIGQTNGNPLQLLFKYMRFVLLAGKFGQAESINGLIYSRFLLKNIHNIHPTYDTLETPFGSIENLPLQKQQSEGILLSAKRTGQSKISPAWCEVPLL